MTTKPPPPRQPNPMYERRPLRVSADGRTFWMDTLAVDELLAYYRAIGITPAEPDQRRVRR